MILTIYSVSEVPKTILRLEDLLEGLRKTAIFIVTDYYITLKMQGEISKGISHMV